MLIWTDEKETEQMESSKVQAIKATYPILIGWMVWACYTIWILSV